MAALEVLEFKDFDPNVGGGVDRDALKASDFVFPATRNFPIKTAKDVEDAVSSWGRYKGDETFTTFKIKLTALARRKGFESALPESWDEEVSKKASEALQFGGPGSGPHKGGGKSTEVAPEHAKEIRSLIQSFARDGRGPMTASLSEVHKDPDSGVSATRHIGTISGTAKELKDANPDFTQFSRSPTRQDDSIHVHIINGKRDYSTKVGSTGGSIETTNTGFKQASEDGGGDAGANSGPTVSDVHVDSPTGLGQSHSQTNSRAGVIVRRKAAGTTSAAYVKKLKALVTGSGKLTDGEFDAMHKTARGHAGGVARAVGGGDVGKVGTTTGTPVVQASDFMGAIGDMGNAPVEVAGPPMGCDCNTCSDDSYTDACDLNGCSCIDTCNSCGSTDCDDDGDEVEPDRDADDIPGLEKADPRVKYRDAAKVGEQCGLCRFRICGDGDDDADDHECVIVEGWITDASVCNLFAPKVGGTTAIASNERGSGSGDSEDGEEPKQFSWDAWNAEHSEAKKPGDMTNGELSKEKAKHQKLRDTAYAKIMDKTKLSGDDKIADHIKAADPALAKAHNDAGTRIDMVQAEIDRRSGSQSNKRYDEPLRFNWAEWDKEHGGHPKGAVEGKYYEANPPSGADHSKWKVRSRPAGYTVEHPDGGLHGPFTNKDHATAHQTELKSKQQHSEEPLDFAEACTVCVDTGEHKNGWAFFTELPKPVVTDTTDVDGNAKAFIEPPTWINYLPKPGIYQSARYGKVAISPERNQRFARNFQNAVYQRELPIDLEHETKLSGAAGYIVAMRENPDRSVDAQVNWTDRGVEALKRDRFHYFSPEFLDEWMDPIKTENGQNLRFRDVAIGGALTTRPFFKERALKSLVMTEFGLAISEEGLDQGGDAVAKTADDDTRVGTAQRYGDDDKLPDFIKKKMKKDDEDDSDDDEDDDGDGKKMSEPRRFAEMQAELAMANQMTETLAEANKQLSERTAALENASRRKRFTEMVTGQGGASDGVRWFGEVGDNVEFLETLADTLEDGEENPKFVSFVERQTALGAQVREAGLFSEKGSDAPANGVQTAGEKLHVVATELVAEGKVKRFDEGLVMAAELHPDWYAEQSDDVRGVRRG